MSISAGIFFCTHSLSRRHKTRIAELTNYLEEINIGELEKIIQTQEDEFSHLEDEIYKTVTTLRQMKEFAESAKQNFAENLTNIAHQLKTKITALSLSVQLYKKSQQTEYIIQIESLLERLNWLEENLCKRQINRDEEKENRAGWSQEKPSGAVNYMDLIMEPLRLAVM